MFSLFKRKYKDSKGKEYKVGDVVFNPFFGDYWVVGEYNPKPRKGCPYYLAQYGDEDEFIDLDEPSGFVIVCSKGDEDYNQFIEEFKVIVERIKEEEAQWEQETQNQ